MSIQTERRDALCRARRTVYRADMEAIVGTVGVLLVLGFGSRKFRQDVRYWWVDRQETRALRRKYNL